MSCGSRFQAIRVNDWLGSSGQLLLDIRSAPLPSRSCSVGSDNGLATPVWVRLGPRPRRTIVGLPGSWPREKPGDNDAAPGADKWGGAEVGQPGKPGGVRAIGSNQPYAGGVIFA